MESSAKIGKIFIGGSREQFLGQKHKSAICDRTPPTYTSNLVYMCAGGSGVPNLQTELKYLNPFKSYCIFSNCKWLPPWRHPCLSCLTCMCMCVCMHACMHMCACMGHSIYPHPHPSTPSTPKGGNPPNQLKCYNT